MSLKSCILFKNEVRHIVSGTAFSASLMYICRPRVALCSSCIQQCVAISPTIALWQ